MIEICSGVDLSCELVGLIGLLKWIDPMWELVKVWNFFAVIDFLCRRLTMEILALELNLILRGVLSG